MSLWSDFMGWLKPPAIKPVVVSPNLSDLDDLSVVARTIWGEARNQDREGMQAVASVIQNRAHIGGWWGSMPREVCLKPYQFSCWNRNDPNRAKLLSVSETDPQYQIAKSLARSVLTGTLSDNTNSADSYMVKGTNAFWARNLKPVASIGDHDFYVTLQV